jgi:glycogen synthase kinase 3 beta
MAKLFTRQKTPPEAVSLIAGILKYDPDQRLKPMEALAHKFFDDLRQEGARLPSG